MTDGFNLLCGSKFFVAPFPHFAQRGSTAAVAMSRSRRTVVPIDRTILEALSKVEDVEGLAEKEICENLEVMHDILQSCDPKQVTKYFTQDHPLLFDAILTMARIDILPLDVPVNSVLEFVNEYGFLKLTLDPHDNVKVSNERLHVTSYDFASVTLPELPFGAARELTLAFYFTVDDFGAEESDQKRFGFTFNSLRVYFSPEQDDAGIDMFRKMYLDWGKEGQEPQCFQMNFSFLEGERVRCVLNLSQDGISCLQVCKVGAFADSVYVVPLALTLTDFCYPTRSTIAQLSVFIEAPRCKKLFSIESVALLQGTYGALDQEVDICWPKLQKACFRLIDLMSPFMRKAGRHRDSHLDIRARVITAVLQLLLLLSDSNVRSQSQDAITSILKHVDRIVLRTQDISKVVPSLRCFIDLLEYYVGLENTTDFEEEKAWLLQLVAHCCADDEHLCAELLRYKEGSLLISLSRMLMDDSKIAWKEVLVLREMPDHDPRQIHPVLMMQRSALFTLSCLMQPQQIADLVMKSIDLKLARRIIGTLDKETLANYFVGQESRKTYTMSFVLVMRVNQCRRSPDPDFQPLVLGADTNLPSVYINLQDFRLWIQVCTASEKHETFVCQQSLDSLPPGQIVVTIVVNGSSIQVYLNEQAQLPNSRKLSDDPKIIQHGSIFSGKMQQLMPKPEDKKDSQAVFDGVLTLLRASQHPAAPHEVENSIRAAQKEAKHILTRKERNEGADSVFNVTEVSSVLLQFIRLQFHDDPATRREKRRLGELDLIDPTTTFWILCNCGLCAQLLPQSHPKYVGLLKTALQRATFLAALVADNFEKTEVHEMHTGFPPDYATEDFARPKPPDHSVLIAAAVFINHLLQSPRGRTVMSEDTSAMLIVRLIPLSGVPLDLSGYVQKSFRTLTAKICALLLQANQDAATTSLALEALFKKSISDEGLIYKEDLQHLLLSQGLTALMNIMHRSSASREKLMTRMQQYQVDITNTTDLMKTAEQARAHDMETILAMHRRHLETVHAEIKRIKDEMQDLEHLLVQCQKLQRQLFLQLHHIMDEIIQGLPLRPADLRLLTQMVNIASDTAYTSFYRSNELYAQKMLETELSEGMPWEVWLEYSYPGAANIQASVSKLFPLRQRMRGPRSTMILNVMEEANLRDERSILSPKLQNGKVSTSDHVFVHIVGSSQTLQADVEVRLLPEFDPPLRLPHEHLAFEGRIIEFAMAVLKNNELPRDAYANVCTLLGSQVSDIRAASCIPHLATLLVTCCRDQWVSRVICGEVLQNILYPDKHLAPILFLAGTAASTPLDTRLSVLQICSQVIHPAMTPEEGFLQFLDNVYRQRIELPRPSEDELPRPALGEEHKKASAVTSLMSALHKQLPRAFQIALFNLAEAILARDAGECADLINENQWADGAVVFPEQTPGKFAFWKEFYWFLMHGHPDVQDAAVRLLLILFWQQSVNLISLICNTEGTGQLSGSYWLIVPLMRLLGHKNDDVVKDILTLFTPLAQSHVDGDDDDDLDEDSEDRLLKLSKSMISDANRSEILREAMVQVSPRFIVRAMDWPCDVRDFVLQVVLTRSVMQELTVSPDLATEFWDVIIHLLRECGLAGQAWVSTTLKELAQIAQKVVAQSNGEDLRMVRSICSPKVIAPLVSHIAAGTVLSDSDVAKEMSHALAAVPDSLLALLVLLPEQEQIKLLYGTLKDLLNIDIEEVDERFRPGHNRRTSDAVKTWVGRCILIFFSAALLNDVERQYPTDCPTEQTANGSIIAHPLPIMVPGAQQIKITCVKKKAMTVDILVSKENAEASMDPTNEANEVIPTKTLPFSVQLTFDTEFAVITPGRAWCCFDKSMSRGENREEFKMHVEPQFMFGSVKRMAVDDFFATGHFKRLLESLLPSPADDPNSVRGVPLGVIQATNWVFSVLAFELESFLKGLRPEPLKFLNPQFCPVVQMLRVVRTVVYRVVAARPQEEDYEALQVQMEAAESTIYTFSRVPAFKEAILGGPKWKNLPLLLDMMKSRLEPKWVTTMAKVLAAIINRKPESIKSPFEALLIYLDLAMSKRSIDAVDSRVLTPVVSVYADLLEAGWTPTYPEMERRPKHGVPSLRDERNAGAKSSDLCRFALLLVNSSDPLMRAACIRSIRVLGGRPARRQPLLHLTRFVNICMLPPDPKTQKPYQGLPPQGLSLALPRKSYHMPPFAYSMWLYLQDEMVRSEGGIRIFHVMSHVTPASSVPQIQLYVSPTDERELGQCRLEVCLSENKLQPNEGKGYLRRHSWAHVALMLGRRSIVLYLNGEEILKAFTSGMQQFSHLSGPQLGSCYVGVPPPDLVPYHAMHWFFPGYIFELAYHDEGVTTSQVQMLHSGGRPALPENINAFEAEEDTESCCIFPYMHFKPTPLNWLVTSDVWEKLEGPILGLLASKDHLMSETEVDDIQLEAVQALRSAASNLLAACFDLDELSSVRLRQWAVNFAQVKIQPPPIIKLHLNDESFAFEFKLRFRQYSNLEEAAKLQTIMANVNEKKVSQGADARDQFRICIESLASTTSDPEKDGMYTGDDTKNCWFLTFVYFQNVTRLKLPPQTGPDGWLHCTIGYVDGKTELGASWDGGEPRIVVESYTKDMFRTEAYLGCEVQVNGNLKKICNQLLCDLAYVRVWDNYEPADKLNEEFADAGAPNAMLVAGNQAVFVCLLPIIHEAHGYILDAVPMSTDVGPTAGNTQKTGPNTSVFPTVRARYDVLQQWPGALFCSQDYVPMYTAPRAISDGLIEQDGLLLLVIAWLRVLGTGKD